MRLLRGLAGGLTLAFFSLLLVLGSIWLALAEGMLRTLPATPTRLLPPSPQPNPSALPILLSPTASSTLPVPPTLSCIPPSGWIPLPIDYGETLETLAERFGVSIEALYAANCLSSDMLIPGAIIYVPQLPTATPIPCGPPPGWIQYIVQPGDTLYRLSQAFGVDYRLLQRANCLGNSTLIYAGQRLWVPNVPTRTPIVTDTPLIIVIATSTSTFTLTPTLTLIPSQTSTPLPTWTFTPTPGFTLTATTVPSATPTPPSLTPTPSATSSPTPTATFSPTPTIPFTSSVTPTP
ncbi:MAG: LysM peptidoglycan-binding domain-containing protein [Anaerolineales bacterium]